jgi:serine protease inhibitor
MRVERPFVFVIRENHSQTILFMGKIVEPTLD